MDAFDADVLIYASAPGHEQGRRVAALFSKAPGERAGVGSALLVPELLRKPLCDGHPDAVRELAALLARLDLRPVDRATAMIATVLAARYRLRSADAIHLATAIAIGAHRFITSNTRDFPQTITEIDVTYPGDLPEIALRRPGGEDPVDGVPDLLARFLARDAGHQQLVVVRVLVPDGRDHGQGDRPLVQVPGSRGTAW